MMYTNPRIALFICINLQLSLLCIIYSAFVSQAQRQGTMSGTGAQTLEILLLLLIVSHTHVFAALKARNSFLHQSSGSSEALFCTTYYGLQFFGASMEWQHINTIVTLLQKCRVFSTPLIIFCLSAFVLSLVQLWTDINLSASHSLGGGPQ